MIVIKENLDFFNFDYIFSKLKPYHREFKLIDNCLGVMADSGMGMREHLPGSYYHIGFYDPTGPGRYMSDKSRRLNFEFNIKSPFYQAEPKIVTDLENILSKITFRQDISADDFKAYHHTASSHPGMVAKFFPANKGELDIAINIAKKLFVYMDRLEKRGPVRRRYKKL